MKHNLLTRPYEAETASHHGDLVAHASREAGARGLWPGLDALGRNVEFKVKRRGDEIVDLQAARWLQVECF